MTVVWYPYNPSDAIRFARPTLHVRPVPGRSATNGPAGFGETEVAGSPLVYGSTGYVESFGDLYGSYGFGCHTLSVDHVLTVWV